jgi:hypothetical protein
MEAFISRNNICKLRDIIPYLPVLTAFFHKNGVFPLYFSQKSRILSQNEQKILTDAHSCAPLLEFFKISFVEAIASI